MGGAVSANRGQHDNHSNDNSNDFTTGDGSEVSISGLVATVPPWMKALQQAEQSKKQSLPSQTTPNSSNRISSLDNSSNVKLQVLRVPVFEKHPTTDFRLLYKLGKGSFSTVYKAELKQNNFIRLAIKEINIDQLQKRKLLSLGKEMNILSQLRHPNIVDLFGVYKTQNKVFLIMEYLKGGELMASIAQRSAFKESDARRVMQQIVSALQYMHKRKVVHRDIKPANLILIHRGLESPVKIVDFGFATIEESSEVTTNDPNSANTNTILCGTPGFLAPEVILSRSYTCKVDIWCLGVVFYILLSGMMPFTADPAGEIRTLNGEYSFPDSAFNTVSSSAKDLIRRMLQLEPTSRITAENILSHPWMKRKNGNQTRIKPRSANYYVDDGSFGYANNDKQALHAVGSDVHYGFYENDNNNNSTAAVEKEDEVDEEDEDVDITKNLPSLRLYYAASSAPPSPEKEGILGIRRGSTSPPPPQKQQQELASPILLAGKSYDDDEELDKYDSNNNPYDQHIVSMSMSPQLQLQQQQQRVIIHDAPAVAMTEEELHQRQLLQLQPSSVDEEAHNSHIILAPPLTPNVHKTNNNSNQDLLQLLPPPTIGDEGVSPKVNTRRVSLDDSAVVGSLLVNLSRDCVDNLSSSDDSQPKGIIHNEEHLLLRQNSIQSNNNSSIIRPRNVSF